MSWQTAVVISVLFFSALIAITLAAFAWRRQEIPASKPFILLTLALAWWSVFYAFEVAATTLPQMIWWGKWQYVGITILPVGWLLFALVYAGGDRWLSWRRTAVLCIVPVVAIVLAFTNDLHHQFWTSYEAATAGGFSTYDASYGIGWYIYFVYAYLLMLIGSVALLRALRNFAAVYRWQLVLLLLSPLLPWISNGLYVLRISPVPQLDLAPFAFTISAVILGTGILRFNLFTLLPVARTAVIDSMSEAMLVLDSTNRIVDMNPAARALFRIEDDPIGQPVLGVLGAWSEAVQAYVDTAVASEEITLDIGDSTQHFHLNISPIANQRGQTQGRLVLLRDITMMKQAEEALAMAQVKTEFLAKVGHELRTPLNGIMGLAEMLEYGVYGDISAEQQDVLLQIIARTQHLTGLVNDVLEQTRLESGQFSLDIRPFTPFDVVNTLRDTVNQMITRKELTLLTEIDPDLPEVLLGDAKRVYQIMLNLVDNAIKFTDAGKIELRLMASDSAHWAIVVSDTGIGIPQAMQHDIFNAFQQAHYEITRTHEGVGLGLAIVHQLVQLMDGTISVASTEGVGTTFTVTLPMALEEIPA